MNKLTAFLACAAALLMSSLSSCATHVLPRPWEVAEVNGIDAVENSFKAENMRIRKGKINWNAFVSPHEGGSFRHNPEIAYSGDAIIDGKTYNNLYITGYPLCAFRCEGKLHLISMYPQRYDKKAQRQFFTFYLYREEGNGFREIRGNSKPFYDWYPWTDSTMAGRVYRGSKRDWEGMVEVFKRLRFKEQRLNIFTHNWHMAELSEAAGCVACGYNAGADGETEPANVALAEKMLSESVRYMEREVAQSPQDFATTPTQLQQQGYFVNKDGEAVAPWHPALKLCVPLVNEADVPRILTYQKRVEVCCHKLLELGKQAKNPMSEETSNANLQAMEEMRRYEKYLRDNH